MPIEKPNWTPLRLNRLRNQKMYVVAPQCSPSGFTLLLPRSNCVYKVDTCEPEGRLAVFSVVKMKAAFKRMCFNTDHNLFEAILYMVIIRLQASDLSSVTQMLKFRPNLADTTRTFSQRTFWHVTAGRTCKYTGWIPWSCFSFRVWTPFVSSHCHDWLNVSCYDKTSCLL